MEYRHLYIGGEFVNPAGAGRLEISSPATGKHVGSAPDGAVDDIHRAVVAARGAFDHGVWPTLSMEERSAALRRLATALTARHEELATTITAEMGAPITFSRAAMAHARIVDFYANIPTDGIVEERRAGINGPVLVRREPVGVAALIGPWNSPLNLILIKLAPALLAGCTVIVKPAPETPLDAYLLAHAVVEAGLPPGVVNIVTAGREVAESLVRHAGVDKVAFTGSTAAGKRIMSICGDDLKRITLELGGKSAGIILDGADLDAAIPTLVAAGTMNSGQACLALTRVLAPRTHYREIVDRLAEGVGQLVVGDPADPATQIGPMVSERQRDRVEGYLEDGRSDGAKVVVGGGRPCGLDAGWFIEPTVFAGVDNSMRIAREEVFGPVICVIPYASEEEAVAIANDSPYGLCGGVWAADDEQAIDVARRVRTGTMTINGFGLDYAAPFGGFKQSGIGREWGREGLDAYLECKTIILPS